MNSTPTLTVLAIWWENPDSLSQDLRENLEGFMGEMFTNIERILQLPDVPEMTQKEKQSEWFRDILETPTWEEIKAWAENDVLSEETQQRVEYFLKRNVVKIHKVLEKYKKAA